jgi:hypothetical protein
MGRNIKGRLYKSAAVALMRLHSHARRGEFWGARMPEEMGANLDRPQRGLAPATPYPPFPIGQAWTEIAGHPIVAAPWREDFVLGTAAAAEALGAVASPSPVSLKVSAR